jgi:hypothetical protein
LSVFGGSARKLSAASTAEMGDVSASIAPKSTIPAAYLPGAVYGSSYCDPAYQYCAEGFWRVQINVSPEGVEYITHSRRLS